MRVRRDGAVQRNKKMYFHDIKVRGFSRGYPAETLSTCSRRGGRNEKSQVRRGERKEGEGELSSEILELTLCWKRAIQGQIRNLVSSGVRLQDGRFFKTINHYLYLYVFLYKTAAH